MRAIVTGGASGLGAAITARLRTEGMEVEVLDLATGFDVSEPEHWERVDATDVACLNAVVLGGAADPGELDLDSYRRAFAVNVDGVVLGVRRLAREMQPGGRIVVTASLAGLTEMADDPVATTPTREPDDITRYVVTVQVVKGPRSVCRTRLCVVESSVV